jgi:sugar/nucleoside kinase (ribokinase family)
MGRRTSGRGIAVCGQLCLDIIPGFKQTSKDFFVPGTLSIVDAPVITTGGAVPNVGLDLHKLGIPVSLTARIGDDPLGGLVRERISHGGSGLARGILTVPGEITSYTVVLSPPGIDRIFLHCPGANAGFMDSDIKDSTLDDASILHLGYPPLLNAMFSDGGGGLQRLFSRAHDRGVLTSLDMSLPDPDSESGRVDWRGFLKRVLPYTDFFAPSAEELLFMLDRGAYSGLMERRAAGEHEACVDLAAAGAMAREALEFGAGAVMIKLGEKGIYSRTSGGRAGFPPGWTDKELYRPVFVAGRSAGTTGAGDAAVAGMLASIFKGLSAEAAIIMAAAVGACCVEESDASSGIQAWESTVSRIQAGWKCAEVRAPGTGWTRSKEGTWRGSSDGGGES